MCTNLEKKSLVFIARFYHQMRQRFFDTIFELSGQLNALLNSMEFSRTPRSRIAPKNT